MKKNIYLPGMIFLLTAGLLFMACDKDNAVNGNNTSGNTISMKNSTFSEATLQIGTGASVTWVNDDTIAHTVTADDNSFSSGDMAPGARFNHTFSVTGTYPYHCIQHPEMTGTVIVVSSSMPSGAY